MVVPRLVARARMVAAIRLHLARGPAGRLNLNRVPLERHVRVEFRVDMVVLADLGLGPGGEV